MQRRENWRKRSPNLTPHSKYPKRVSVTNQRVFLFLSWSPKLRNGPRRPRRKVKVKSPRGRCHPKKVNHHSLTFLSLSQCSAWGNRQIWSCRRLPIPGSTNRGPRQGSLTIGVLLQEERRGLEVLTTAEKDNEPMNLPNSAATTANQRTTLRRQVSPTLSTH